MREAELKNNRTIDPMIDVGSDSLKRKPSDLEKQKAGLEKDIAEQTRPLDKIAFPKQNRNAPLPRYAGY
ncbi:MAG: hypothetical protein ACI4KM_08465 [Oscillospiraceae bacterium]